MNILITGSSGYVGSSFINAFESKYSFLKFSLLRDNLDDLELTNIDTVLHCAALVHQKTELDYKKYDDINVKYPITLAKKAKKTGVKQFIFISTIAVCGEDAELLTENTECNPITPYGKSKLEAEKQLLELNDENFIVSIVRPPMIYGKDAPGNIQALINLVKKVPILPFAGISNKRSFVYIGNLLHEIDTIIQQKAPGTYLAADDKAISTSYLIEKIAQELNKKNYLIKIPLFELMIKKLKPSLYKRLYTDLVVDNQLSKKKLNFTNPYSTEQGIHFMIHGENK